MIAVSEAAHAQAVMERDVWETIARERHATLEQLQADCSHHKTIRWAFRFSVCAVIMMISTMLFAGTLIVAAALRAPALPSKCVAPPPLERL